MSYKLILITVIQTYYFRSLNEMSGFPNERQLAHGFHRGRKGSDNCLRHGIPCIHCGGCHCWECVDKWEKKKVGGGCRQIIESGFRKEQGNDHAAVRDWHRHLLTDDCEWRGRWRWWWWRSGEPSQSQIWRLLYRFLVKVSYAHSHSSYAPTHKQSHTQSHTQSTLVPIKKWWWNY